MIAVGATVLALVPLAIHGGPLWQPLCCARIGGLSLAASVELLLVRVLYAVGTVRILGQYHAVFVLDLKQVRRHGPAHRGAAVM